MTPGRHESEIENLSAEFSAVRAELEQLRDHDHIRTTMEWIATTRLDDDPLVSVIVPTRDRRDRLEAAIGSVSRQLYENWEIVVVDDGSTDDTPALLDTLIDERIRRFHSDGAGVCAARNLALDHAKGDLCTYLDDDNLMHPLWLKTVAWAGSNWPQSDVFYGARVFDNFERAHGLSDSGTPWMQFIPWDRTRVEHFNILDMNVIAHRSGLPEAHFDESLSEYGDWDLVLRLTQLRPPVRVPAIACAYSTDADGRLSGSEGGPAEIARIREKISGPGRYAAAPGEQRTRVLMVGLDALDPGIARRLAAEGRLPHFASLLASSTRVAVRSPLGIHSSAAWPTVFTGRGAGEHGYHCWVETTPDYEDHWTDVAEDVAGTPFWEVLSRAGRRSAVLDVPHSLPDPDHDGVQLIEWGCHDRHHGTSSVPRSLADELTERFGQHPVGCNDNPTGLPSFAPCDYAHRSGDHRTTDEARSLFDDILIGQARKDAVSLSLLSEGGWDLFLTVLGESHCTGHQLWAVHDAEHPWHDASVAAGLGDPVEIVYERLDRTLGRLIAAAGDDASVLVLVPHGMGPHYSGTPLLDQVLHRIEVADSGGPQGGAFTRVAKSLWGALPDRIDEFLRRRIATLLRSRLSRGDTPPDEIPPRRDRRWFRPPSDEPFGPIRLNVIGRETNGKIAPGTEFDAVCDHLRDELLDLINVETGEPAVRDVVRSDTVYPRRPDDTLADLFVAWNSDRPVEAVYSRRVGLVVQRQTHWRTGDHPADGIFLASGPHIAEDVDLPPVDPEDIAPTVCALLGVDLPDATGAAVELKRVRSSR